MIALIRYPVGLRLPEPWEPDWQHTSLLPALAGVARAPEDTPLPFGATWYHGPVSVGDRERVDSAAALATLERAYGALVRGFDDKLIAERYGIVHPLHAFAPWGLDFSSAVDATVRSEELWDSRCSRGVIRAVGEGRIRYVDRGRGNHDPSQREGPRNSIDAAEVCYPLRAHHATRAGAVQGTEAARGVAGVDARLCPRRSMQRLFNLPWEIVRGPCTAAELTTPQGCPATSWDLPTWLRYPGHSAALERYPEAVTWWTILT